MSVYWHSSKIFTPKNARSRCRDAIQQRGLLIGTRDKLREEKAINATENTDTTFMLSCKLSEVGRIPRIHLCCLILFLNCHCQRKDIGLLVQSNCSCPDVLSSRIYVKAYM